MVVAGREPLAGVDTHIGRSERPHIGTLVRAISGRSAHPTAYAGYWSPGESGPRKQASRTGRVPPNSLARECRIGPLLFVA